MFLMFVNDIVLSLDSHIFLYADDLKIVRVINNDQDCYTLQRDIDYLSEWCVENKLSLNINKCETMTLSRKKNKIVYNY